MRLSLIIFFCAISFSASAQWWHITLKRHEVLPQIKPVKDNSLSRIKKIEFKFSNEQVRPIDLGKSQYNMEASAFAVMQLAKHNMRFRIYNEASYNFSDLATLYIQLNRLSEAKWYFLQSSKISREENDDKHTISNLINLAKIKCMTGDVASAKADLLEAHDLAQAKDMQAEMTEIDRRMGLLVKNLPNAAKPEVKYAETAGAEKKAL